LFRLELILFCIESTMAISSWSFSFSGVPFTVSLLIELRLDLLDLLCERTSPAAINTPAVTSYELKLLLLLLSY
jgi:hypothetical protein